MKSSPLVYVLILNWNGKKLTIDCVSSVLKSDYPDFRVVVIDNGSTDGSTTALRKQFGSSITVLENTENLGYARGFNVGLAYAFVRNNADYCLVMNNDTIIDQKAMSELLKVAVTDNAIGFVTGKVYYYNEPLVLQTVGKKQDPIRWNGDHIGTGEVDHGQYDRVVELHFADDIFTLVSRRLFMETGGYNPMFFLQGEEYDWQARAKKLGYRIMFTPRAKLWHKVSVTLGKDSASKAFYDARNPMLVVLIHRDPQFFKSYFWYHVRQNILRSSLIYLKRGDLTAAIAKWQGFFSGLGWGFRNYEFTLKHFL